MRRENILFPKFLARVIGCSLKQQNIKDEFLMLCKAKNINSNSLYKQVI